MNNVDPSCCINFDTKGVRNVFCSTEFPICALRVRQFARKIKIECLLKYHALVYDESKKPTPEQLKKVSSDEVNQGKFKGWGYYYSISNNIFRKTNPLYFTVDKTVSISFSPSSDPQAVLKLRDLKFSCKEGHLCNADEYASEEKDSSKFKSQANDFNQFLSQVDVSQARKNCVVVEGG